MKNKGFGEIKLAKNSALISEGSNFSSEIATSENRSSFTSNNEIEYGQHLKSDIKKTEE